MASKKDAQRHIISKKAADNALQEIIAERLLGLSPELLAPFDGAFRGAIAQDAPKNVAELQQWFQNVRGIHIPDAACFPHTQSPMEFVASVYFRAYSNIVAMGSRDSGKTFLAGEVSAALMLTKPGITLAHAAANKTQAKVLSHHLHSLFLEDPVLKQFANKNEIQTELIRLLNRSQLLIVTGSASGVSSQHPNGLGLDEVDFMTRSAIEHSLPVPTARMGLPASWFAVSTRQFMNGVMNYLMEEKKSFHFIEWTVFEAMKPCRTCEALDAHPFGSDEARSSVCNLWADCRGQAAIKARGWKSLNRVRELRQATADETWDAQIMGRKPSMDALVYGNLVHKEMPHGNHSNWVYSPHRPLYVFHDPAEGQTAVFLLAQIDDEQRMHIFAELIVENCTDPYDGKECYFDWAASNNLRDPDAIIIDPARTDAINAFIRGSKTGLRQDHSYNAVPPSRKNADGGQIILQGIKLVRAAINPAGGTRRLFYNPAQCPNLDYAFKDYAWKIDKERRTRTNVAPQDEHKDIMDTLRYGVLWSAQQNLLGGDLIELIAY